MKSTIIEKLNLRPFTLQSNQYDSFIDAVRNSRNMNFLGTYRKDDNEGIFFKVGIKICLPSRGVYNNLDIRCNEELVFFLSERYPYCAPSVMFNRIDFPYKYLPHVNMSVRNEKLTELNLCLYRGDIDSWFYSVGPYKYIERVFAWIEDAVTGNLIKDDGFEQLRISSYGNIIYDYNELVKYINEYGKDKVIGFFKANLLECCFKVSLEEGKNEKTDFPCICICDKQYEDAEYWSEPIECIDNLKRFACFEILQRAIRRFKHDYCLYNKGKYVLNHGIIVIMAIKRPQRVIGYDSNYEMINVLIPLDNMNTFDISTVDMKKPVILLSGIKSFSEKLAKKISSNQETAEYNILLIGCGAIGSKISMHLARMGFVHQTIIDEDRLYPHNMARYGITTPSMFQGYAKAAAVAGTINAMYDKANAVPMVQSAYELEDVQLQDNDIIIDCTASDNVMGYLTSMLERKIPIIRIEVADNGKLGVICTEGEKINPNIMDLRCMLWFSAVEDDEIFNWLNRTRDKKDYIHEELGVGCGCSSDTMILDDATISNHASILPAILKETLNNRQGRIYINKFDTDNILNNGIKCIEVEKFICLDNEAGWNIRILSKVYNNIKLLLNEPNEEAGIFFGHIDVARKSLHILDYFIPNDNIRLPNKVVRGEVNVKEKIEYVQERTNGIITYVGEWHTHPKADSKMSDVDYCTYKEINNGFDIAIPKLMIIFGEQSISCYIGE